MFIEAIDEALGIKVVVEHSGKRGRPKGSKNGVYKDKWKKIPVSKRKKRLYNPATNILSGRVRP